MQTIFSTTDVLPANAFAYWQDACDKTIRRDYIEATDRNAFYAHLEMGSVSDLSIMTWGMAPMIARNNKRRRHDAVAFGQSGAAVS